VRAAAPVALVVGSLLSLVNLGSTLVHDGLTGALALKVDVNYLTPFVVASIGYLAARRRDRH